MRNVLFLSMPVNRMYNILRCCFLLLFISLTGLLHAQQLRYQFKNYTPSDGLPSSETYQVLRDASNYMWFATDHGVTRYNGYEFETFNLPDNSIMGLYEDGKKRIWAYTFSGRLFYYEHGKFHDYKWNDKLVTAIKPGVIQSMYVDSGDVVHLSSSGPVYITITADGVLNRQMEINSRARYSAVELKQPDFFIRAVTFPESFRNTIVRHDTITELSIASGGRKLMVTLPKLIQHERCRMKQLSDGRFILYTKDCYVIIKSERDYRLIKTQYTIDDVEEVDGNIFLATEQGIQIINKKGEPVEKYLEGIHISSIEKDYEGGIWFTTLTNGAYYLNPFRIKHLSQDGNIIDKRINLLYKLSDATILAGVHGNEVLRFKA
ncbi:MAG TPA: hypothetical protein VK173_04130, partial [Lacibacter sp.]|nr:hypothetical protein [Lacibacter sp.]